MSELSLDPHPGPLPEGEGERGGERFVIVGWISQGWRSGITEDWLWLSVAGATGGGFLFYFWRY
jgi:hypothetical protein